MPKRRGRTGLGPGSSRGASLATLDQKDFVDFRQDDLDLVAVGMNPGTT